MLWLMGFIWKLCMWNYGFSKEPHNMKFHLYFIWPFFQHNSLNSVNNFGPLCTLLLQKLLWLKTTLFIHSFYFFWVTDFCFANCYSLMFFFARRLLPVRFSWRFGLLLWRFHAKSHWFLSTNVRLCQRKASLCRQKLWRSWSLWDQLQLYLVLGLRLGGGRGQIYWADQGGDVYQGYQYLPQWYLCLALPQRRFGMARKWKYLYQMRFLGIKTWTYVREKIWFSSSHSSCP